MIDVTRLGAIAALAATMEPQPFTIRAEKRSDWADVLLPPIDFNYPPMPFRKAKRQADPKKKAARKAQKKARAITRRSAP